MNIKMSITSDTHYYIYLQNGTRKMAKRPIREPVKAKARPEIVALFSSI